MARNYNIELHQQWIGYLNPTGLVFSPQALEDSQVVINEAVVAEQKTFRELVCTKNNDEFSFVGFKEIKEIFKSVLSWQDNDINEAEATLNDYSFIHPQFNEVVRPSFVVNACNDQKIIIQSFDTNIDFDSALSTEDRWNSSVHFKLERLLREKQVSTGILVTKNKLRLVYAPRGETSGYIDFPFDIMIQPSGRLVFAAFVELFSATKVFNSKKSQALVDILDLSRKYQAKVSIELSGQVLEALYELLRGFQSANDESGNELLKQTLETNKQDVYEGLLTVLLRMVFIMYAEDRNLLAADEVYHSSYSLAGLYERLRQDEAQNPDTMDSRYGAWAQLLSLFRLIYDGAEYESEKGSVILPARHGHLFDPNRFLFLEGRSSNNVPYLNSPKISDGVVFRVLSKLLILNSERISYRTLDVEQIGSVYETMMGFELDIAKGETRALKPQKSHGAPVPINLEEILLLKKDRSKRLTELTDTKFSEKLKKDFESAKSIEELEIILEKRIDTRATPFRLSKGAMILKPSEARRKSGSHYTPRELTRPIVENVLGPIFEKLGLNPKPEVILNLKICDPAMGSGAFLVEVCRQLSEKLIDSWHFHRENLDLPSDEDELLFAKRLIAQRCLYGVDKNHMAVNLAKLSLWLVTLARNHSFSFLDHNFKFGDSLVGLSNKEIMAFDYREQEKFSFFSFIQEKIQEVVDVRTEIQVAGDEKQYDSLKVLEESYEDEIRPLKYVGDLLLKSFFDGKNDKERGQNILKHQLRISNLFAAGAYDSLEDYCKENLNGFAKIMTPFHWEIEYPEVFKRENPGFDCIIGNPPFLGGKNISGAYGKEFLEYLNFKFTGVVGQVDLVVYFFRKSFSLLRNDGCMSLISTNSISQGDSRQSGLKIILSEGATIFNPIKRLKWPGVAAVVVSVVNISKSNLDNYSKYNSFLIQSEIDYDPNGLNSNKNISDKGFEPYGRGFFFSDDFEGSNSISLLESLKSSGAKLDCVYPMVGGEHILGSPNLKIDRWVIYFGDRSEEEASSYPELFKICKDTVKLERSKKSSDVSEWPFWKFWRTKVGLFKKLQNSNRYLVHPFTSTNLAFTFIPSNILLSAPHVAFCEEDYAFFCCLQNTIHETWVRFFASSMKDDLRYTSSDCFENFPLPRKHKENVNLEEAGKKYFEYRSYVMEEYNEGLTKLYNRFHDPDESDEKISLLRENHQLMDKAVLDAYGWGDLKLEYEFILDFEDDEDDENDTARRKKKPYRHRFTAKVHDEILARLLSLNQERYEEEVKLGLHKKK